MVTFLRPVLYCTLTALFSYSLSSNTVSADQPRQKKDKPLEFLHGLQSFSVCGATAGYRGTALVDMLSYEIANKVISRYQGGNILYCEKGNTLIREKGDTMIPSIQIIPNTTNTTDRANAPNWANDLTDVNDLLRAKTAIGPAPHARIFSEGKMYQVAGPIGKEDYRLENHRLDILVCPYTEYQGCMTECHDYSYRWFSDTNLDGECDWISMARKELGRRRIFYYRPLQDKDTHTKRRAQQAYEKVLRKVAKCYGIKEEDI